MEQDPSRIDHRSEGWAPALEDGARPPRQTTGIGGDLGPGPQRRPCFVESRPDGAENGGTAARFQRRREQLVLEHGTNRRQLTKCIPIHGVEAPMAANGL
jgi:hypothetical protein